MNEVIAHLVQAICSLPEMDKVEAIGKLLEDYESRKIAVEILVQKLSGSLGNHQERYSYSSPDIIPSRGKGKKERGKKLRQSYISELQQKGILVEPFDNVWAETSIGLWVATPTATIEWRPGRWFLGLSENRVREKIDKGGVVIILLCQTALGLRLDFVLPPELVKEIVGKLSNSKGELKFNVRKVGERYTLVIPDKNNIDISNFKGKISILTSGI